MSDDKRKQGDGKARNPVIMGVILALCVIILSLITALIVIYQSRGSDSVNTTTTSSSIKGIPSNPRESATTWMSSLLSTTSKKFSSKFFSTSSNTTALMKGDYSAVPKSIQNKMTFGTDDSDMTLTREQLNGASYAGLIMFSIAYKNTNSNKITTPGYKMTSYDKSTGTVYIPVQALVSSDQTVQFQVRWSNGKWTLMGDPIGWDMYVLLENASNSSSTK